MDTACHCRPKIPKADAVSILCPRGKLLAVFDKDCPVHGYAVTAERAMTREEFAARHAKGDFNHILVNRGRQACA